MHSNIYPVYNALEPAQLHTASVTWKGWQHILLDKVSYLWSHTFRREQMGCVWVRKVTKPIWAPSKPRVSQELELEYGSELRCITEFYPFLIFKFIWKNWAEKLSTVLSFSAFISSTLRKSNLYIVVYNSNLFSVITNLSHFVLNCTLLCSGGETLKISTSPRTLWWRIHGRLCNSYQPLSRDTAWKIIEFCVKYYSSVNETRALTN